MDEKQTYTVGVREVCVRRYLVEASSAAEAVRLVGERAKGVRSTEIALYSHDLPPESWTVEASPETSLERYCRTGAGGVRERGWRLRDGGVRSFEASRARIELPAGDLALLAKAAETARDTGGNAQWMLEQVLREGRGMRIGGRWHPHAEVAAVLRRVFGTRA